MFSCALLLPLGTPSALAASFSVLAGNLPPFNHPGDNGAQGISVDVITRLLERSGNALSDSGVQFPNWPRAMEITRNAPGHVLISVARTPAREDAYKWVGPIHSLRLGLVSRKDRKLTIHGPEDMSGLRIGVIRDSAPAEMLQEELQVKPEQLLDLSTNAQQFRMLAAGRVDLITHTDMASVYFMNSLGMDPEEYEMVYVLFNLEMYAAFSPHTPDSLIEELQDLLLRMRESGELQQILRTHLDGSNSLRIAREQ